MSKRIGNVIIIAPEEPQQCDECGEIDELRPYGKGRKCICYGCAMKDPKGTEKRMAHILFGEPIEESDK